MFPLDAVPDAPQAQAAQRRRLARWNRLLAATVRYPGSPHKTAAKTAIHRLLSPVPYRWIFRGMERECRRYEGVPTERVALLSFDPLSDRWVWPHRCFDHRTYLPFEFTRIPVPTGYDAVLTAAYGDYRVPRQEPTCHTGVFYDPYRDYRDYLRKDESHGGEKCL